MQVTIQIDDIVTAKYWEDLFHGNNLDEPVMIEATGTLERKVRLTVDKSVVGVVPSDHSIEAPILFEWWEGDQHWESRPRFEDGVIKIEAAGKPLEGIMLGLSPPRDVDVTRWFSDLKANGKEGKIVKILASWYSEIKDLAILMEAVVLLNWTGS